MASPTKLTQTRRKNRDAKLLRKRHKKLRKVVAAKVAMTKKVTAAL
jgi:hypothetical protein